MNEAYSRYVVTLGLQTISTPKDYQAELISVTYYVPADTSPEAKHVAISKAEKEIGHKGEWETMTIQVENTHK